MKKQFLLTKEGVEELQAEHDHLVSQRGAIAERIKTAREFGDLAENAEYSTAMQEKEQNDSRVAELEYILQNVELIKKPTGAAKVQLGSHVKLTAGANSKEFRVVGTVEADPLKGKISDESPIGKALLGKKEGDDVEIVTPAETSTYKITSIS